MNKKLIYGGTAAATIGIAAALYTGDKPPTDVQRALAPPEDIQVFMNGSENVSHDRGIADLIDAPVNYGLYCTSDAADLMTTSRAGDVVISARADSYKCLYTHPAIPTYPVVGASNRLEFVGDDPIPNVIFISNGNRYGDGFAYGQSVDYYIQESNLGDAMATMSNILVAVNQARVSEGLPILTLLEMKEVLDASSDEDYVSGDKYFGQMVDVDQAILIATNKVPPTPPTDCSACAVLPAVYSLLLE